MFTAHSLSYLERGEAERSSVLYQYFWLCLPMTPLLLPVSQQACQPESTDQSPVSASHPLKPAWQWTIINTWRVLPFFLWTSLMFGCCWPQSRQTLFVFKEILSPRRKSWNIRAWYTRGWKNLMGTGMTQITLGRADRTDYGHWQLNSAAVRAGGDY